MNERNVANNVQTRYSQYEGTIFMPEDKAEGPKGEHSSPASEIRADTTSAEAVRSSGLFPKIEIPFKRAKTAIEVLSAIRGGRDVVVDKKAVLDFKNIIIDFAPDDKKEEISGQIKDLDANATVLVLDETIRNATITATTREEADKDFAENQEKLKKEKKRLVEMGVLDEDKEGVDDKKPLENQLIEEQVYDLSLMNKASKFAENPLKAEQVAENITFSEEDLGREPNDSGPGTMGPTGPDWVDDLPDADTIATELGPFVDELKRLKALIGVDYKAAQDKLILIGNHFTNSALDSKLGENEKGREEIREAMDQAQVEISIIAKTEIDRIAAAGGMDDEYRESQYLYYGMTTMPKVRNLGREDSLKHELGEADYYVEGLIRIGALTEADLKKINKLSVDDLAKFKEGNFSDSEINIDVGDQKEIYKKLKEDQEVWLHKKIEKLPWENLDVSRIGNNIAFREFNNAQNEMVPEVEEYARGLSRGSELKYAFTKNGMEAMMSNSSVLRETLEILSEKVHGWDEIVSETESFITRKKLDSGEERMPDLRKRWKDVMDGVKNNKTLTADQKWAMVRSRFSDDEFELMKKAAVGLYVYEENKDGSVRVMNPKKNRESSIDKQILGKGTNNDESWKVGGFVGFKDIKDVTKMREHLFRFAKEHLEKEAEKGTFTKEEVKARAKIAAFMGEWFFWRMKGRSAYWGEQGGKTSAAGAGKGENELFLVIGFQQYMCQESKGNGEVGRRMRKLAVGADTLGEYLEKYVPGMAGGVNMNLGLFDFYSQYSGFFPGERWNKPLQNAGFIRGYGKDQGAQVKRLNGYMKEVEGLMDSGVGNDEAWGTIRKKMSDKDKDFLEEYNNLPIVTLANKSSREALANISKGKNAQDEDTLPYGDAPDWYGGDFAGPNKLRGLMVEHDSGFLSKPDAGMLGAAAQLSEGRKRVWQRAKLMKDMAGMLLEFKSLWNKEITGRDNWNAGNADEFLTDVRNEGLIVDRSKKDLERDYYRKVVDKGLARLIPFADTPFVHKLSFIYAKKQGNIAFDTILAMILEWFKKFPSAMAGR